MREKKKRINIDGNSTEIITLADALGMSDTFLKSVAGSGDSEQSKNREKDDTQFMKMPVRLFLEKKGRGGKIVTVLSGLLPQIPAVQELVKALKNELGCGASVDNNLILFQGDQRQRLFQSLQKRSFSNVKQQ